jgi:hypothetical protein
MARFERDFRESQRKFHDIMGTDDADLSAFRQRGGKMILWHGEADQLIFPRGTINYFNRVLDANGGPTEVNRFARLYMAPGVGHCGGGIGPAPTGLYEAIVDWVEKGVAPTTILAASTPGPGAAVAPTRTRPLCPYPTIARWIGSGSSNEAANFACVAVNPSPSDFTVR